MNDYIPNAWDHVALKTAPPTEIAISIKLNLPGLSIVFRQILWSGYGFLFKPSTLITNAGISTVNEADRQDYWQLTKTVIKNTV